MYNYKIYCTDVISDIEIPQLIRTNGPRSTDEVNAAGPFSKPITICEGHYPDCFRPDKTCFCHIASDECYLTNSYCLIYIEGDSKIVYEKREGKSQKNLVAYLLGWGMSMLFYKRGVMAIHCSCVYNDEGAILVSGNSGAGKSTVTTYLLEHGYKFMADDVTMVGTIDGEVCATPAFPFRKLCRDVVRMKQLDENELIYIDEDKDKFLVPYKEDFIDRPLKIHTMIMLICSDTDEVEVNEAKGMDKLNLCMNGLFLRPVDKSMLTKPEVITSMLKMASAVRIFVVERPTEGDTREQIAEVIKGLF